MKRLLYISPLTTANAVQNQYVVHKYINHRTRKPVANKHYERDLAVMSAVFLLIGAICLIVYR